MQNIVALLRLSGISPCFYGFRKFRRVATAVGNFARLLRLSDISPCCYGNREFRRVATAVLNFAVLLATPAGNVVMIATAVRYNCRESPRVARAVGYLIVLLYNLAAETMGLAKVECVVIEDSAIS